jgi:Tfp pilus assembly protein PilO
MLVDPELGRGEQVKNNLKRTQKEIDDIKETASDEAREKLRKEKDDLVEQDKENRKMLPPADQIPDFIDSMQRDARNIGLRVKRFDRLGEESENLYNAIPIKMTLEGTALQLIQLLRLYAGSERRVITIGDLAIERVAPESSLLKAELDASKPLDQQKKEATKTPEAVLLEQIELAELARKHAQVRATFTAYAFVWTGKPPVLKAGAVRREKSKKKRT